MTISSLPLLDVTDAGTPWPDEVADLTDRRRILVRAVLGVDLPRRAVDQVFCLDEAHSSSTTMRSGGREPSTDDT